MRIGRNLTVQEIYNIVNYYLQNYTLTEEQINAIIQNVNGALGCLSLQVGVSNNLLPALCAKSAGETLTNGVWKALSWDTVYRDYHGWVLPEDHTAIALTNSGIHLWTVALLWAAGSIDKSGIKISGLNFPTLIDVRDVDLAYSRYHVFTGIAWFDYSYDCLVEAYQASGGDYNLTYAELVMKRLAIWAYPVE